MCKIENRICRYHGITEFVYRNGRFRCRKCSVDSSFYKRKNIKKRLVEYKGGKCENCGYDKCIEALDFHHLVPSTKEFPVNAGNFHRGFDKLLKEVDKCILLCCRCHRELHAEINLKKEIEYENLKVLNENEYLKTNKPFNHGKIFLNKESIIYDINSGLSQKDLSLKYNVSLSTMKRFIWENGLSKKHTIIKKGDIINSFKLNPEISSVCKHLNITRKVLLNRIKKYNLQDELNRIRTLNGLKNLNYR